MKFQKINVQLPGFLNLSNFAKILTLGAVAVFSFSCSLSEHGEIKSIYEGVWTGSYTGSEDAGTWEMIVDSKGNITGSIISEVLSYDYEIIGNVENTGELYMSCGTTSSGATFTGYMFGDVTNGTWENPSVNITGEWDGRRTVVMQ